jgi:hypothetical protein
MSLVLQHFRINTVMLSGGRSALTLTPVEWGRESTETEPDGDGGLMPVWELCEPEDERAEPNEVGGKMTELRIEGETDLRPGAFVTLTLDFSRPPD